MPIKNLTLGLGLLLAGSALAQHQHYKIKDGDTLSTIAEKFHVRTHALVKANDLSRLKPLKVGRVIVIPSASSGSDRSASVSVPSDSRIVYRVHQGEFDWIIAKRHGLSTHQLHLLNPTIHWDSLHPGTTLVLGSHHSAVFKASSPKFHLVSHAARAGQKVASSTRTYKVRDGENDWIIAHRIGLTTVKLRHLNPNIDLALLHTGQKIQIPADAAAVHSTPRIHSRYAVINGDSVNIRRHPNTDSETVTQVDSGLRVVILDRDGDWYRLRFPKGSEGWVRGGLLKAVAAPHYARTQHRRSHYYAMRHRRHHHSSYSHNQELPDDTVASNETSESGDYGTDAGGKILAKARAMRGIRYRWGAMSRSATDCSGFTSQVFKSQGYRLPRTSSEQSRAGNPVRAKDLKPGDLVFFHTMRGARVTHVGIYMGKGKFIHASSAGGHVQVNSLADGYYQRRLVAARRVAKSTK